MRPTFARRPPKEQAGTCPKCGNWVTPVTLSGHSEKCPTRKGNTAVR